MPESEGAIAAFLAGYPPEIRAISQRLRELVASEAPDAIEMLFARHNNIGYALSDNMRDLMLYICPLAGWVRLGFYYGGGLADPNHLIEGAGKRMRHVKVRTMEQANDPALARLTAAGWIAGVAALAAR